jgi:endonuclease-3
MTDSIDTKRKQYVQVAEILEDVYGYPTWRSRLSPVEELVSTILSQNTNDTNRDRAFNSLTRRFTT